MMHTARRAAVAVSRRGAGLVVSAAAAAVPTAHLAGAASAPPTKTDAEWRERLTPEQYYICRQGGTERPGSSPLNREKRTGTFACVACATPLFEYAHAPSATEHRNPA
jgi:hypothetical protein